MTENAYWSEQKLRFDQETDLNIFKTWNSVLSVPLYAHSQFESDYATDLARMYYSTPHDVQTLWQKVLKEPILGHTVDSYKTVLKFLSVDGAVIECTPWTLKCGHHVLSFLTETGRKLSDYDQIIEFGPGIGETCRIINDLGFTGDYYLYDLPEVLRISTFYNKKYPNVKGITHYSQVKSDRKTLFIGTWSISEVPIEYRDEVFEHFKNADFLIVYQHKGFEYNNHEYFNGRFKSIIGKDIKLVNIDWLNHIAEGNKYLFNI